MIRNYQINLETYNTEGTSYIQLRFIITFFWLELNHVLSYFYRFLGASKCAFTKREPLAKRVWEPLPLISSAHAWKQKCWTKLSEAEAAF
jgi:hypothetical protein